MYAVIRTGGKQYRVAPGDVVKVEKLATEGETLEFDDVLAFSDAEGTLDAKPTNAKVVADVLGDGRAAKILVFHLKRKKQYKKMQGHRQNFVEVRINEILVNGKSYKAEGAEASAPKADKKPAKKAAKKTAAAAE